MHIKDAEFWVDVFQLCRGVEAWLATFLNGINSPFEFIKSMQMLF